jgi:short-subunit dehydrogenase
MSIPTILWLSVYTLSNLYMLIGGPVDVKKKYNAKWALVTGAATGIGKSIVEKMASLGLNVVLVSLPEKVFDETTAEFKKRYPELEFRQVTAKFDHKTDYMPNIIKATKDMDVQIIFNNAGYIVTGFFDKTTLDSQLANLECNATACVKVTHHFLQQLLQKKMKGCFLYTSSVSGYIPNPFAVMYGATKGFVSQFAASLAVEVRAKGIDVIACHPSPVASNFFDNAHKLGALEMAKQTAVPPSAVPDLMLTSVGRAHYCDMGSMAWGVRLGIAPVPYDFIAGLFSFFSDQLGDYTVNDNNRGVPEKHIKK